MTFECVGPAKGPARAAGDTKGPAVSEDDETLSGAILLLDQIKREKGVW